MNVGEALQKALRRGWCPGALRPMMSGDGLIVRLRIIGGALTPMTARAIADLAEGFGNGHIDLTSRANLQIRGLSARTLPPLQSGLDRLGLIDPEPASEAVRNIVVSPLAGLDPTAVIDIRPSVNALDARLRRDRALWRLPGKFGFLIDDGGRLSIAKESADIGFIAERSGEKVRFSLFLGGRRAGSCAVEALADTGARLASAFLALRGSRECVAPRMAALVRLIGVEPILRAAGIAQAMPDGAARGQKPPGRIIGEHDLGRVRALGVGAPFGRLEAATLRLFADAAAAADGELRLTPWRAILIVGAALDPALVVALGGAGLALEEDDPIRAVAACPGAPACANGSTATQPDGARLAVLARRLAKGGVGLHVSGCAKGCAHAATSPITLVGRAGRYDLVLDGRASDKPALVGLPAEKLHSLIEILADAPQTDRATAARLFDWGRR